MLFSLKGPYIEPVYNLRREKSTLNSVKPLSIFYTQGTDLGSLNSGSCPQAADRSRGGSLPVLSEKTDFGMNRQSVLL